MSHDKRRYLLNFQYKKNYATPIPMYILGDDNKIRSKIMLFTIKSADSRGFVDVDDTNFITNL